MHSLTATVKLIETQSYDRKYFLVKTTIASKPETGNKVFVCRWPDTNISTHSQTENPIHDLLLT